MTARIAVLGPGELVPALSPVLDRLPAAEFIWYLYRDPAELPDLIDCAAAAADGLLFTEWLALWSGLAGAAGRSGPPKPQVALRCDQNAVAQALLRICGEDPRSLEAGVSTDNLYPDETQELAQDLAWLGPGALPGLDLRRPWDRRAVAAHHRLLLRQGAAGAAAVSLAAAYRDLVAEGLPAYLVRPASAAVRQALSELVSQIELAAASPPVPALPVSAAAVLPAVDESDRFPAVLEQLRDLALEELPAAGDPGLAVQAWDADCLVVSGPRSAVAGLVGDQGPGPVLARALAVLGAGAVLGRGCGASRAEAEHRALLAVGLAGRGRRRPGCPGVSPASRRPPAQPPRMAVQQALEAQRRLGRSRVTAAEVASALRLSERSARRMLLTLSDLGAARHVGDVRPEPRGRPRHLYELRLR